MRHLKRTFDRGNCAPSDYALRQLQRQQEMLEQALAHKGQPDSVLSKATGSDPMQEWQAMTEQRQVGNVIERSPKDIEQIRKRQLKAQRALML